MKRRGPATRILKWTGTISCFLLAGVIVASGWYTLGIWSASKHRRFDLEFDRGRMRVARLTLPAASGTWTPGLYSTFRQHHMLDRTSFSDVMRMPSTYSSFTGSGGPVGNEIEFPFWIPALVLLVPMIILWHRDRRPPPGHCPRCRYNLTGNTSGVCSECGLGIAAPQPKSIHTKPVRAPS